MHRDMFRLCSTQVSIPRCSTAPKERLRQRYDKCDEYLWQPTYQVRLITRVMLFVLTAPKGNNEAQRSDGLL
ncbi:MAG: hypothetical protein F6K42_38115 [Leptolyngbya sp. SIO1D8]|nr:hypothetical protein [Leptolyngbya sp. SIO1D8]